MASTVDKNFQTQLFSFGKTPQTASAASEAPDFPGEQLRHSDDDGRNLPARGVGRVGFLGIDLNVAPPEDGGYEFPVAESGGAWVSEVSSGNREEIGSHSSDGEITKISGVRQTEGANTVTDSGNQNAEKMTDQEDTRCWDALIEAARHALRDYGESARDNELKAQNRKRRPSREAQAGGGEPRRKIGGRSFAGGWDEFVAAPAVVVRSTRGRVVAMPNKYKDSVLHAAETAADFRFSRRRPR